MTLVQSLKKELKEYLILSGYLYLCFSSLILYKLAIIGHIDVAYLGVPLIKALVLGKFILLGHAMRLGRQFDESRMIFTIVGKSVVYLALLIVLSILEEIVVGAIHGQPIGQSLSELGGGTLAQAVATSVIIMLILIPYLASRELDIALGEGRLWEMLFQRRM